MKNNKKENEDSNQESRPYFEITACSWETGWTAGKTINAPMTSAEFHAIRLDLGLTQAELGKLMGMPQAHIARIERGERQPTKIHAAFARYIAAHPPK